MGNFSLAMRDMLYSILYFYPLITWIWKQQKKLRCKHIVKRCTKLCRMLRQSSRMTYSPPRSFPIRLSLCRCSHTVLRHYDGNRYTQWRHLSPSPYPLPPKSPYHIPVTLFISLIHVHVSNDIFKNVSGKGNIYQTNGPNCEIDFTYYLLSLTFTSYKILFFIVWPEWMLQVNAIKSK